MQYELWFYFDAAVFAGIYGDALIGRDACVCVSARVLHSVFFLRINTTYLLEFHKK